MDISYYGNALIFELYMAQGDRIHMYKINQKFVKLKVHLLHLSFISSMLSRLHELLNPLI